MDKKHNSKFFIWILVLMFIFVACHEDDMSHSDLQAFAEVDLREEVDLLTYKSQVYQLGQVLTEGVEENYVFSPISAWLCYELYAGGLTEKPEEEMLTLLEGQGTHLSVAQKQQIVGKLMLDYSQEEQLSLANLMAISDQEEFNRDYLDYAKPFDAKLVEKDFVQEGEKAKDDLNAWVSEKTKGLIPELFTEPFSKETLLVLVNTIYFNGEWEEAFDEAFTSEEIFTTFDGGIEMKDMMNDDRDYSYASDEVGRYMAMYYETGERMIVMLPEDKNLHPKEMLAHYQKMPEKSFSYVEGHIQVPVFTQEYN